MFNKDQAQRHAEPIHLPPPHRGEWEFAARGGNKSLGYKYSGSNIADEVAWYNENSDGKTHPVTNPQDPSSGSDRVGRGGSWDAPAGYVRVAYRNNCNPGIRFSLIGFRLVCSPR